MSFIAEPSAASAATSPASDSASPAPAGETWRWGAGRCEWRTPRGCQAPIKQRAWGSAFASARSGLHGGPVTRTHESGAVGTVHVVLAKLFVGVVRFVTGAGPVWGLGSRC